MNNGAEFCGTNVLSPKDSACSRNKEKIFTLNAERNFFYYFYVCMYVHICGFTCKRKINIKSTAILSKKNKKMKN